MLISTITKTNWIGVQVPAVRSPGADRAKRIVSALGLTTGDWPKVNRDTLARYYAYLAASMSLPFSASYPQPTNAQEETEFRCTVLELLDPAHHLGDEWDGVFCKTRKGNFDVNLPLMELNVPNDSPNFDMIEDYCRWFWNWR
jgi:hypothetical protein